jgi:hypothetical protein
MQPADHRKGDHLPSIGGLALAWFRGVLAEREVDSGSVIVIEVLAKDASQVLLPDHDDVVEAVPPQYAMRDKLDSPAPLSRSRSSNG